jgi:hypothetical protein
MQMDVLEGRGRRCEGAKPPTSSAVGRSFPKDRVGEFHMVRYQHFFCKIIKLR